MIVNFLFPLVIFLHSIYMKTLYKEYSGKCHFVLFHGYKRESLIIFGVLGLIFIFSEIGLLRTTKDESLTISSKEINANLVGKSIANRGEGFLVTAAFQERGTPCIPFLKTLCPYIPTVREETTSPKNY